MAWCFSSWVDSFIDPSRMTGGKHTVTSFRRNQLLDMARISRIRWIVSELSQSSSPIERKVGRRRQQKEDEPATSTADAKESEEHEGQKRQEEIDRDIPGLDCLQDIFNFLVDVGRKDKQELGEGRDGSGKKKAGGTENHGGPRNTRNEDVLEEEDGIDILSLVPTEEELMYANEVEEGKGSDEEDSAFIEVDRYEDVECDNTCYKMFLEKLRKVEMVDTVRSIRR